jgi:saccharopine dehydrogenase-like NADP-dependent oxidoreductase
MQNVLIIGLGKVGSLVATLLYKRFNVKGLDKKKPSRSFAFDVIEGDVTDEAFIERTLTDFDAVVSCMPYNLTYPLRGLRTKTAFITLT